MLLSFHCWVKTTKCWLELFKMHWTKSFLLSTAILSEHLKEKCSWENCLSDIFNVLFFIGFIIFSHWIYALIYTLSQQSLSGYQNLEYWVMLSIYCIEFLDLENHRILFGSSFSKWNWICVQACLHSNNNRTYLVPLLGY